VIERPTFRSPAPGIQSRSPESVGIVQSSWQHSLPILRGASVTLRELEISDASALVTMVASDEVSRFISPPPPTVDGFERFIEWTRRERALANGTCFAVVPKGCDQAVGLFQIRRLEESFETAEWGFAIGSGFWHSGLFMDSAQLVLEFAFEVLGVHRLEARAAVSNGRGSGALRKVGAVREGVLHNGLLKDGKYLDQALWTIHEDEWRMSRRATIVRVH
jgi:RimJ/RimL family protein N-acetyltransferase